MGRRTAAPPRNTGYGWSLDAVLSRVFFDPQARLGWRHRVRRRALETAMRFVHRAVARQSEERRRLALQELGFKLRALALFSQVDWVLALAPSEPLTLANLLARARMLGPEEQPWVMEGIGRLVVQRLLATGALPVDLLHDQRLPEWSLGTLHTGMGMALAIHFLAAVRRRDPSQRLERNLERFLALCRRCSRPGYGGMAEECLGFVLRFLAPHHVAATDAFLRENRPELVAPLWHGVGRALYFLPGNLVPGRSAPWRVFDMVHRQTQHAAARENLLAGLAWPLLLVNWQQPRILEQLLEHHGEQLRASGCFSAGLGAAMVMWVDCTAGATRITELLDHQPSPPRLARAWSSILKEPCLDILTRIYPALKKSHRMEAIFRHPLPRS